jgi:hypothetical protein
MIGGILTVAALVAVGVVSGRLANVILAPSGRPGPASPCDNGRSTLAPADGPIESGGGDAGRARLFLVDDAYLEAFDLDDDAA